MPSGMLARMARASLRRWPAPPAAEVGARALCTSSVRPGAHHLLVGTYTEHTGYATGHAPGAYLAKLDLATGEMELGTCYENLF